MSIETPKNKPEEIKSIEESEDIVEMLPEDFAEMIAQLPILKEIMQEWETRLLELEKNNVSAEEIEALRNDIEELRYQISEREELLEE